MITSKTPDQFASHVKAEIAKWTKVVAEAKLEGD
jgi:tripartite-type tricarboxylate transporter receptor subunit TctC